MVLTRLNEEDFEKIAAIWNRIEKGVNGIEQEHLIKEQNF